MYLRFTKEVFRFLHLLNLDIVMGLFSAFRSTSSVASEFKKTYSEACQFFVDVSYEPNKYSWNTIQAKKNAYMSELVDLCKYRVKNPRDEAFTIYTNGENPILRLNMSSALVIAQKYIDTMENGERLSSIKTDFIINDVLNNCSMLDYQHVVNKYCNQVVVRKNC